MATEQIPGIALGTEQPAIGRLGGFWLWLARLVWITLVGVILTLAAIGFGPGLRAIEQGIDEQAIVPHEIVLAGLEANHIPASTFVVFNVCGALLILGVAVGCGAFIFWKRSDDLMALMLSLTLISLAAEVGVFLDYIGDVSAGLRIAALLVSSLGIALLFPLLALFPDGHPRPRWVILPTLVWFGLVAIYVAVEATGFADTSPAEPSSPLEDIIIVVCLLAPLLSFPAAMVYRYRRLFTPAQRQQTKLVVYAAVLLVLGLAFNYVVGELTIGTWETQRGSALPALVEVIGMLATLPGLIGLPLAVVFAMQRYRLWDVDFLINRTLVAGALTVLLACVFVGAFFGLNAALMSILGEGQTAVAAALATLALALLFNPARRAILTFVDRRLYGIKVDYAGARREDAPPKSPPGGPGTTSFGEFTGLTLLGRGGMGEVYRGQHPTLGRPVAIKILPGRFVPDENARERFLREAQLIAKLKHPNIVSIYDFGEHDSVPFMIMEYIDGPDLGSMIKTRGALPLGEALPLLADIAAALDFIHQNGVVHRDVKPSNILVEKVSTIGTDRVHRAVLTDFGIARMLESASQLTQGGMIGTLDYISPEQIQGASKVDARADVYSFGVLAYHVLTGELPFQRSSPGAMVLAHMMQPPPDPRTLSPNLSDRVAGAVIRAMAKKPDLRFGSAGEFAGAIASG